MRAVQSNTESKKYIKKGEEQILFENFPVQWTQQHGSSQHVHTVRRAQSVEDRDVCLTPTGDRRTGGGRRTVLAPRILRLEPCPTPGKTHWVYFHKFTSMVDERGVVFLNAVMEFLRPAKSLSMMKVILHRCREAVTSNTCEYFATWPFSTAICSFITMRGLMWSNFITKIEPEFKCPIMAANYTVSNGTLELSLGEAMVHLNIAGNVWDTEVSFFDQDKELFTCVKAAVLVNRVNIKD
ncbi:Splicing factor 3B subunit 3 [Frankliniella fusca]|uniref:Splicing factor 3B subunit 3 n=1 Tax=Frankliniella fusca TaxID=407009 RepID=A0AAE1LGD5_9NEOP|nr:Splicing factor 3B subunit 3 [Frankliniella fusca]